jgi:hypothetical protein
MGIHGLPLTNALLLRAGKGGNLRLRRGVYWAVSGPEQGPMVAPGSMGSSGPGEGFGSGIAEKSHEISWQN